MLKKKKTRHHIKNKCNKGTDNEANILMLFEEKHNAWHLLFRNEDLDGAIAILQRVKQIKQKKYNHYE